MNQQVQKKKNKKQICRHSSNSNKSKEKAKPKAHIKQQKGKSKASKKHKKKSNDSNNHQSSTSSQQNSLNSSNSSIQQTRSRNKRRKKSKKTKRIIQQFQVAKLKTRYRRRVKRKMVPLPAEIKQDLTLIQKPQINDPEIDKQMEDILYNVTRGIIPKGRKRILVEQYKPRPPNIENYFTEEYFPFKQDPNIKKIIPKFINSPLMPPSLRRQNSKEINNIQSIAQDCQQNKLNKQNKREILNKLNPVQQQTQSTKNKKVDDQQVVMIATLNSKPKKAQQLQFVHKMNNKSQKQSTNINPIKVTENRSTKQSIKVISQSTKSSKPEVFFNKSGAQAYLMNLCKK